jgi:UDP-2,3-diacylglucosamine pyrophosphatase LpxH
VPNSARRRYKLVVSDFHLGKGRYFRDGTQNLLEDFVYDREFAEFLDYYRQGDYRDADVELIFNGDILNLLQIDSFGVHSHIFTERLTVRALEKIIAGHSDFFAAIRKFTRAEGHTVAFVVGNHDAAMLWEAPRRLFSEACGTEVKFSDVAYEFDGIYVEHGQQWETFSRINMKRPFITRGLPEPILNLPWGSLFTAVLLPALKQERPHADKVRPFSTFQRWIAIHDTWCGIKSAARVIKFVLDTMLFKTRYQIRQGVRSTLGLVKDLSIYPNYDKIAFRILDEKEHVHTVIFGHTHVLRHRQWREGKLYVNEGTWNETTNLDLSDYGRQIRLTYAFIEYPVLAEPDANIAEAEGTKAARPKVRLKQWNGIWKPESETIV